VKQIIGSDIRHYKTVGSTNDVALELAAAGVPEGVVVYADAQERGRGRIGRSWNSGLGKGLYLSVILRPRIPVAALGLLSLAAGVAVREAILESFGLEGMVKWPNDLLVEGKKIAGVLIESRAGDGGQRYVVLGIGINTNWEEKDLEGEFRVLPTSLSLQTGEHIDIETFFPRLLCILDRYYQEICAAQGERLLANIVSCLDRKGKQVTLSLPDRSVEGIIEGIDSQGGLVLNSSSGVETFFSGELVYADRH